MNNPIRPSKRMRNLLHALLIVGCAAGVSGQANAGNGDPVKQTCNQEVEQGQDILDVAATNGSFKTLINLVVAAGLDDALRGDEPLTVFAPTDEAFEKLPAGTIETLLKPENKEQLRSILLFHVAPKNVTAPACKQATFRIGDASNVVGVDSLQGGRLELSQSGPASVNNTKIVAPNIRASNGYIHVIDQVLLPAQPSEEGVEPENRSVIAVARKAGNFKTLLAALEAADLTDALDHDGSFTVFAPTDEAFAKLPEGTVEGLLKPENKEQLRSILLFHVSPGWKLPARKAIYFESLKTMQQKQNLDLTIRDGRIFVENAAMIASDIRTDNGIIHVIDTVLIPGPDDEGPALTRP